MRTIVAAPGFHNNKTLSWLLALGCMFILYILLHLPALDAIGAAEDIIVINLINERSLIDFFSVYKFDEYESKGTESVYFLAGGIIGNRWLDVQKNWGGFFRPIHAIIMYYTARVFTFHWMGYGIFAIFCILLGATFLYKFVLVVSKQSIWAFLCVSLYIWSVHHAVVLGYICMHSVFFWECFFLCTLYLLIRMYTHKFYTLFYIVVILTTFIGVFIREMGIFQPLLTLGFVFLFSSRFFSHKTIRILIVIQIVCLLSYVFFIVGLGIGTQYTAANQVFFDPVFLIKTVWRSYGLNFLGMFANLSFTGISYEFADTFAPVFNLVACIFLIFSIIHKKLRYIGIALGLLVLMISDLTLGYRFLSAIGVIWIVLLIGWLHNSWVGVDMGRIYSYIPKYSNISASKLWFLYGFILLWVLGWGYQILIAKETYGFRVKQASHELIAGIDYLYSTTPALNHAYPPDFFKSRASHQWNLFQVQQVYVQKDYAINTEVIIIFLNYPTGASHLFLANYLQRELNLPYTLQYPEIAVPLVIPGDISVSWVRNDCVRIESHTYHHILDGPSTFNNTITYHDFPPLPGEYPLISFGLHVFDSQRYFKQENGHIGVELDFKSSESIHKKMYCIWFEKGTIHTHYIF